MFEYLEQEVLYNMMREKSGEAFHLAEPVLYFFNGFMDQGKLGFQFVFFGVATIMLVLIFIIVRMYQNDNDDDRGPKK